MRTGLSLLIFLLINLEEMPAYLGHIHQIPFQPVILWMLSQKAIRAECRTTRMSASCPELHVRSEVGVRDLSISGTPGIERWLIGMIERIGWIQIQVTADSVSAWMILKSLNVLLLKINVILLANHGFPFIKLFFTHAYVAK